MSELRFHALPGLPMVQPGDDLVLHRIALVRVGDLADADDIQRVAENGRRLAPVTGADPQVVELFAVFHDACREGEGVDRGHGRRGAELQAAWNDLVARYEEAHPELAAELKARLAGERGLNARGRQRVCKSRGLFFDVQ